MNIVRGVVVLVALTLSACGGCGDDNAGTPDAMRMPDARVCTAVTARPLEFIDYDTDSASIVWRGPVTGDFGDGNVILYNLEFYNGIEPSLSGTFDLAAGNQANYQTCAVCVRGLVVNSMGMVVKTLYQKAGTVVLTQNPYTTKHVIGTITGLQLEEVTIDSTYKSTPVVGGVCADFAVFNVDRDHVPSAYATCARNTYEDSTTCNCVCGAEDPDCTNDALPVAGCTTSGSVCVADACVAPPGNDTCGSAVAVSIGVATNGTTVAATRDYNSGLEGAGCAGVAQPGRDVVYKVELTAAQAITVSLTGLTGTFDGSISLLGPTGSPGDPTVCDAAPITTCVEGVDAAGAGAAETFVFTATDPGTYYIVVDSKSANGGGAFTLNVTSP